MAIAEYSKWSVPGERWRLFTDWLRKDPPPGPLRGPDRLKALIRVALIVVRKFRADEIPLRASALTFTVLLSLVPFPALGTAVVKELGVGHNFRHLAHRFVDQLDRPLQGIADGDQDLPPDGAGTPSVMDRPGLAGGNPPPSISAHLRRAIDRIFDYVDRTNFAAIGVVGVIGFVISALVVFASIEKALNVVWQVENSRSLVQKVIEYLALVLLLPPALNAALAAEAAIRSPALHNRLPAALRLSWVGQQFFKVFPVGLMIVSFAILYGFLPNTRVRFRSALVGGLMAGGSWFVVQIVYLRLQVGVARYNAIYGSFATLPLFLLWRYLGWLTFLAGAIISFATQNWRTCLWERQPPKPLARLGLPLRSWRWRGQSGPEGRLPPPSLWPFGCSSRNLKSPRCLPICARVIFCGNAVSRRAAIVRWQPTRRRIGQGSMPPITVWLKDKGWRSFGGPDGHCRQAIAPRRLVSEPRRQGCSARCSGSAGPVNNGVETWAAIGNYGFAGASEKNY